MLFQTYYCHGLRLANGSRLFNHFYAEQFHVQVSNVNEIYSEEKSKNRHKYSSVHQIEMHRREMKKRKLLELLNTLSGFMNR